MLPPGVPGTMSRYPRAARDAKIKCLQCNAPVTETVDGGYACVDCGRNPLGNGVRRGAGPSSDEATALDESSVEDDTTLGESSVGDSTPDGETATDGGSTFEGESDDALGIEP